MENLFTYEACKELLIYTCTGILIGGCILWYLYLIVQILIKAGKLVIRFVKWLKNKRHPAEEALPTESSN